MSVRRGVVVLLTGLFFTGGTDRVLSDTEASDEFSRDREIASGLLEKFILRIKNDKISAIYVIPKAGYLSSKSASRVVVIGRKGRDEEEGGGDDTISIFAKHLSAPDQMQIFAVGCPYRFMLASTADPLALMQVGEVNFLEEGGFLLRLRSDKLAFGYMDFVYKDHEFQKALKSLGSHFSRVP